MSAEKQAKRFVKKLGRKLSEGGRALEFDYLKGKFQQTVTKLPKGPVKTKIKKNYVEYFKRLWRAIKRSEKLRDQKKTEVVTEELPYNTYSLEGKKLAVEKLKKADQKTKQKLGTHLLGQVFCEDDLHQEVVDILTEKKKEPEKSLAAIELEKSVMLGKKNRTALHKHMHSFVRKMTITVEGAILAKDENRGKELQKLVLNFIVFVVFQNSMIPKTNDKPSFEDLLAAILSLYLDLAIFLARGKDNIKQSANRVLCTLLTSFENQHQYVYDALLQVSSATEEDAEFMLPIFKRTLQQPPEGLSMKTYIKYISTVRTAECLLRKSYKDDSQLIMQNARKVIPPSGFLEWLREVSPDLLDEVPLTTKASGAKITKYLLKESSMEFIEELVDCITEFLEKPAEEVELDEKEEVMETMFYVDKSADKEMREKLKVEFSSQTSGDEDDLQNRINALIANMETLSDDQEQEEMERNNETTEESDEGEEEEKPKQTKKDQKAKKKKQVLKEKTTKAKKKKTVTEVVPEKVVVVEMTNGIDEVEEVGVLEDVDETRPKLRSKKDKTKQKKKETVKKKTRGNEIEEPVEEKKERLSKKPKEAKQIKKKEKIAKKVDSDVKESFESAVIEEKTAKKKQGVEDEEMVEVEEEDISADEREIEGAGGEGIPDTEAEVKMAEEIPDTGDLEVVCDMDRSFKTDEMKDKGEMEKSYEETKKEDTVIVVEVDLDVVNEDDPEEDVQESEIVEAGLDENAEECVVDEMSEPAATDAVAKVTSDEPAERRTPKKSRKSKRLSMRQAMKILESEKSEQSDTSQEVTATAATDEKPAASVEKETVEPQEKSSGEKGDDTYVVVRSDANGDGSEQIVGIGDSDGNVTKKETPKKNGKTPKSARKAGRKKRASQGSSHSEVDETGDGKDGLVADDATPTGKRMKTSVGSENADETGKGIATPVQGDVSNEGEREDDGGTFSWKITLKQSIVKSSSEEEMSNQQVLIESKEKGDSEEIQQLESDVDGTAADSLEKLAKKSDEDDAGSIEQAGSECVKIPEDVPNGDTSQTSVDLPSLTAIMGNDDFVPDSHDSTSASDVQRRDHRSFQHQKQMLNKSDDSSPTSKSDDSLVFLSLDAKKGAKTRSVKKMKLLVDIEENRAVSSSDDFVKSKPKKLGKSLRKRSSKGHLETTTDSSEVETTPGSASKKRKMLSEMSMSPEGKSSKKVPKTPVPKSPRATPAKDKTSDQECEMVDLTQQETKSTPKKTSSTDEGDSVGRGSSTDSEVVFFKALSSPEEIEHMVEEGIKVLRDSADALTHEDPEQEKVESVTIETEEGNQKTDEVECSPTTEENGVGGRDGVKVKTPKRGKLTTPLKSPGKSTPSSEDSGPQERVRTQKMRKTFTTPVRTTSKKSTTESSGSETIGGSKSESSSSKSSPKKSQKESESDDQLNKTWTGETEDASHSNKDGSAPEGDSGKSLSEEKSPEPVQMKRSPRKKITIDDEGDGIIDLGTKESFVIEKDEYPPSVRRSARIHALETASSMSEFSDIHIVPPTPTRKKRATRKSMSAVPATQTASKKAMTVTISDSEDGSESQGTSGTKIKSTNRSAKRRATMGDTGSSEDTGSKRYQTRFTKKLRSDV